MSVLMVSVAHEGRPDSIGLGLAVSRKLARMMHGDLTDARNDGELTAFVLALPISDD